MEKLKSRVTKHEFEQLKSALHLLKEYQFTVVSGSMAPIISTDENIRVSPESNFKRFDIVVFWNGKILVSHYIWHFNQLDDHLITRGLNSREDLPLKKEQILGKVVSHQIPSYLCVKLILTHWLNRKISRRSFLES